MSDLSKLAPRPPFANYDIVVYFGTGLFSLPILQHFYLIPLQMKLRSPLATTGDELIDSGLSILIILFLAYLIGHGLAYASGQLIQKAADGVFGKTSGAIIWESLASDSDRNKRTRELIRSHLGSSFKNYNWFANFVRAAPHIPVLPIYWAIYRIGISGAGDCPDGSDLGRGLRGGGWQRRDRQCRTLVGRGRQSLPGHQIELPETVNTF